MKFRKNQIENYKEALMDARNRKDMLDILGGTDNDKKIIDDQIKELENKIAELEGNIPTQDTDSVPEQVESNDYLSVEDKIEILGSNINYYKRKKESLSSRMNKILEQIKAESNSERAKDLKDMLIKLDADCAEISVKISEQELLLKELKEFKKKLDSLDCELFDIDVEVEELLYEYQKAKALDKTDDANMYALEIRRKAKTKKALENKYQDLIDYIDQIKVEEVENSEYYEYHNILDFERVKLFFKNHWRIIVSIVVALVTILVLVFGIKTCISCNNVTQKTLPTTPTVSTTSPLLEPTTQPTTQPTTAPTEPTTSKLSEKKSSNNNYTANYSNYSGSNNYQSKNTNNKTYKTYDDSKDMDSSKDSKKDEGKTGGNKGYKASTSNKVESPKPEKIFEANNTLPPTVSQEEIDNSPTVALTPRTDTVDNLAE